jgi:DNA ligase-1
LEKRALIADWLKQLPVEDAARASLYLAGQSFAETDARVLNLGGAILSKALAQVSGANDAALHQAYLRHGDLGAAAEDLLAARDCEPEQGTELTLALVDEQLGRLAAAKGPAAKLPLTVQLLSRAKPIEAKYLIKLALGDMRTGVKQSLVEEAIAFAFNAEPAAVRHATMLVGSLPEVVRLAAAGKLAEARMSLFHPLGFMLASPVDSVDEAVARFAIEIAAEKAGVSEANPPVAGNAARAAGATTPPTPSLQEAQILKEAQIEDKYDGIRAQLHCGDRQQPGRVAIFSRSKEDMTAAFPELAEAFAGVTNRVILDGEVMAWDLASDRALPFSRLQGRIGRKKVTDALRAEIPIVFLAFDLLYLDGELLLEHSLEDRRAALQSFSGEQGPLIRSALRQPPSDLAQSSLFADPAAAGIPRLVVSPAIALASAEQLDQAYLDARLRGNEGVMIKSRASIYQPGRRGLAWLKLKRELATLDVVVTAAEYGHGKRAGILSDYTFAVRDGDELKNVGKAYSGLTDPEIAELSQFFMDHTIEDFGYVRSVEPILVLEVAFNNIMRSDRHASGFALRFPRIVRIRRDKPVEEIDTLARVEEVYASQPELARSLSES